MEGYSSCLIEDLLKEVGTDRVQTVYDPFCGTGTTSLVASKYGITSYYSETNPFMQQVIEAKINCVKALRDSGIRSSQLRALLSKVEEYNYQYRISEDGWDGFEKFFDPDVLNQLRDLLEIVNSISEPNTHRIALILLASVTVRASKMIRQGDLRCAKETEKTDDDRNIVKNYIEKILMAIDDIESDDCPTLAPTI